MGSIASEIHIALTEEQKTRLANSRQTVPDAYVAYLKGRYDWNKRTGDSMEKAEQYFQQAIDQRSNICRGVFGTGRLQQWTCVARVQSPGRCVAESVCRRSQGNRNRSGIG